MLQLISYGHANPAIAELLFISQETVKTHLTRLLCKLDGHSRADAVAVALPTGVIQ